MRASRWFAAIFGCAAACAVAADGLELSLRSRASAARLEAAEADPGAGAAPARRDALVERALQSQREHSALRSGCRLGEVCYEAAEGRLVYRGARRYMPAWEGLAPEGLSLRRDRLLLRYSFR